jgi:4'-phosphopantetheinyl transferase EntD
MANDSAINQDLKQTLASWFTPPSVGAFVSFGEPLENLDPVEEPAVAQAVEKRRREFRAGRHCARLALRQLCGQSCAIPQQRDRQPLWPAAIAGSISHAGTLEDGCALALVAWKRQLSAVGVDIEVRRALGEELWDSVLTPNERRAVAALPTAEQGLDVLLRFSAKEAFYKALYPLHGVRLGFHDVELTWLPDRFCARVAVPELQRWLDERRCSGTMLLHERWVVTRFLVAGDDVAGDNVSGDVVAGIPLPGIQLTKP